MSIVNYILFEECQRLKKLSLKYEDLMATLHPSSSKEEIAQKLLQVNNDITEIENVLEYLKR